MPMSQWKWGEQPASWEEISRAVTDSGAVLHTPPPAHDHRCVIETLGERARLCRVWWQEHLSPPKLASALPFTFLHPPKLKKLSTKLLLFSFFCCHQLTSTLDSFWWGSVHFRCWMFFHKEVEFTCPHGFQLFCHHRRFVFYLCLVFVSFLLCFDWELVDWWCGLLYGRLTGLDIYCRFDG